MIYDKAYSIKIDNPLADLRNKKQTDGKSRGPINYDEDDSEVEDEN